MARLRGSSILVGDTGSILKHHKNPKRRQSLPLVDKSVSPVVLHLYPCQSP